MTSDDLTKQQAQAIHDTVRPMLNYLYRLRNRNDTSEVGGFAM